jgi:pyruvate/2-oxoglutarate dehydrogenase complex dihydrolipoamide dehydrogenase (E3) component
VRDRTLPIAEESCATIRRFRLTLPVKEKGLANPPTRRPHEGPMAPGLEPNVVDVAGTSGMEVNVTVQTSEKKMTLRASDLLVATGRIPKYRWDRLRTSRSRA